MTRGSKHDILTIVSVRRVAGIALAVSLAAGAIDLASSSGAARGAPALPRTPPDYSVNWSGYQIHGGPFTAVSGTFNVPHLAVSAKRRSTAEWVGISGSGVDSLIQAGVTETSDPSAGTVRVSPWWEALPYFETPIRLTVGEGDRVTVTIERLKTGTWGIWMTDDTTGRSDRFGIAYAPRGTSADWIVERPASASSGQLATLGLFSPAITFTDTGLTGHQHSVTEDILTEDGVVVATPSKLTAAGFSVSRQA